MEPSRVWYQVNPPGPSNNICAPSRKSTHALERLRWPLNVIRQVAAVMRPFALRSAATCFFSNQQSVFHQYVSNAAEVSFVDF